MVFVLQTRNNLGCNRFYIGGDNNMKQSPMSDEFHDWLDQCPVQWFRGAVSKGHVAYYFETPDKDVNDEENEDDSN